MTAIVEERWAVTEGTGIAVTSADCTVTVSEEQEGRKPMQK